MENVKLNNGVEMPKLGIGTFMLTPDQAEESDNISNLSVFGKILANQSKENEQDNTEFKVG